MVALNLINGLSYLRFIVVKNLLLPGRGDGLLRSGFRFCPTRVSDPLPSREREQERGHHFCSNALP
jgi:hypothetical protein